MLPLMLKPQDVLVLLKLAVNRELEWTYASLSASVGMSASETHASIGRSTSAGLFSEATRRPSARRFLEFVIHGVPYAFYSERRIPTTRGMLTGFPAPPLDGPSGYMYEQLYVWPTVDGQDAGWSVDPLYRSAPFAARQDDSLYRVLALVDELRLGRARERNRAADLLAIELSGS